MKIWLAKLKNMIKHQEFFWLATVGGLFLTLLLIVGVSFVYWFSPEKVNNSSSDLASSTSPSEDLELIDKTVEMINKRLETSGLIASSTLVVDPGR